MHTWVLLQIQKDQTLGIGVKDTETCVREPGFKAILSHILIELRKLRVLVFSLIKCGSQYQLYRVAVGSKISYICLINVTS